MDIDYYIKSVKQINHPEALEKLLSELTQDLRLKHFWYMALSKSYDIENTRIAGVLNNYPQEFVQGYLNDKRYARCPVLHHAFNQTNQTATWSELFKTEALNETFQEQLEWASKFNVTNGISCPIHGPNSDFALFHFVINDSCDSTYLDLQEVKTSLMLLSQIVHQKMKDFLSSNSDPWKCNLTAREFECLVWAARGKTVWETAKILAIAECTVREYVANCLRKLNASTKPEAITKAILMGIIKYTDIITVQIQRAK